MVFYNKEPFGGDTKYFGSAIVAKTYADMHRGKGKPRDIKDFMPKFEEKKPQSPDDMVRFAEMMTAALGGEDKREKE